MSAPNPTILDNLAKRRQVAAVDPDSKAKVVRPGRVNTQVSSIHDGIIKTKHLEQGLSVRPYVKGAARGGVRVIKSIARVEDGAFWDVTDEKDFTQRFPAAYRWYCEALDGATVTKTVKTPAFVPYHEEA